MRRVAIGLVLAASCAGQEGTRVFISRCIQCHDPNSESHAPLPEALGQLPWQAILKALETGSMKAIGAPLSAADKIAVARYLGKAGPAVLPEMKGFCTPGAQPKAAGSSWNGWGVDEKNTRYQPAMVRDAVVIGPGPRAYFGDLESNFYALDANTGKMVWQKKLDNQPFTRITGTAKLHDGRLYVPITSQEENAGANPQYSCCTFRGNLVVVNASDGSVVWRTYTTPEAKPTGKSSAG